MDAVLGPPSSAWVGGARGSDGHSARGGHAARDERHLLLPVLHELQARVGWISEPGLGYVCRRLTIPPAEAYGVASFYALFALEPRPPRVAHICTDIACMCRGARSSSAARADGRPGRSAIGGRQHDLARESLPGHVRAGSGCARDDRRRAAERPRDRHGDGGRRRCALDRLAHRNQLPRCREASSGCSSDRPRRSDQHRQLSQRRAATPRCAARSSSAPPASSPRSPTRSRSAAAAPPSPQAASGTPSPAARRARTTSSATPTNPSPARSRTASLIEGDPFALIEAMTIAGVRHRLEHGYLYIRGEYPLAPRAAQQRDRRRRAPAACSATTSWAPASSSTSSCAAAPAPTSAARRPRSSTRSRATAASRATSRRSRSSRAVRQADRRQQRRDAGQRARHRASTAARRSRQIGTEHRRVRSCSACPAMSRGPGVYEVPFGITLARADRARRRRRRRPRLQAVLLGGAAGAFVGPDDSTCR